MTITEKHRRVANLLWQGELTIEQIAQQEKISPTTIYNWKNKPEFDTILKQLDESYRLSAKRKALRLGCKAIDTLEELLKWREEKSVDTARKAACNVLETGEVMPKEGEREHSGEVAVRIIRETVKCAENS